MQERRNDILLYLLTNYDRTAEKEDASVTPSSPVTTLLHSDLHFQVLILWNLPEWSQFCCPKWPHTQQKHSRYNGRIQETALCARSFLTCNFLCASACTRHTSPVGSTFRYWISGKEVCSIYLFIKQEIGKRKKKRKWKKKPLSETFM